MFSRSMAEAPLRLSRITSDVLYCMRRRPQTHVFPRRGGGAAGPPEAQAPGGRGWAQPPYSASVTCAPQVTAEPEASTCWIA